MLTICTLMHHMYSSFAYSLKHMHHTGSQETAAVVQEATEVEEQEEEL